MPTLAVAHPVEQQFNARPMYHAPNDWSETPRAFTVTVAGPERLDGEAPYTVVVDAPDTESAWARALAAVITDLDTPDVHVVAAQSFEGLPAADCGYCWHDLRPQLSQTAESSTPGTPSP